MTFSGRIVVFIFLIQFGVFISYHVMPFQRIAHEIKVIEHFHLARKIDSQSFTSHFNMHVELYEFIRAFHVHIFDQMVFYVQHKATFYQLGVLKLWNKSDDGFIPFQGMDIVIIVFGILIDKGRKQMVFYHF